MRIDSRIASPRVTAIVLAIAIGVVLGTSSLAAPAEDRGKRRLCAGLAGLECPGAQVCVDDPRDNCKLGTDPDCGGICVGPGQAAAGADEWEIFEFADGSVTFRPAAKGGKPGGGCCDPSLEPGQGNNPLCYEGHTCCASGAWSCNHADGSPSCTAGEVCVGCAGSGAACGDHGDCCSGKCKGNGTCR